MERHRLFINYRISDTGATASALYRDLVERLGKESVFIDHGRIEGGEEWPKRIWDEVELSTAMLCLIGKDWLEVYDPDLQMRKLDLQEDWVRSEISRALERGITVIPILVEEASPLMTEGLPEVLSKLATLQARRLRRADWDSDLTRILEDLGCISICAPSATNQGSNLSPLTTSPFLALSPDVRSYLKKLITTMRVRNKTTFAEALDPYIDLAAEQREDQSPTWKEYPRERGNVISFPQIHPTFTEVAGVLDHEGVRVVSNIVGKQTRTVRSVLKVLQSRRDPLVLLGEPGAGKSTTMRELVIQLAQQALISPIAPIPIYVELGAFRDSIDHAPNKAIINLIREAVPPGVVSLRNHLGSDSITTPIVVLFDGMDEIPRQGDYANRTAALATFASDYVFTMRTVFACRTNDFDTSFGHQQLVIKPFDERRIRLFLSKTLGKSFEVNGEKHSPKSATRRLMQIDELGAEAGNPLTLSLAVQFMRTRQNWPRGRIPLFEDHIVALAAKALYRNKQNPSNEQIRTMVDAWAELAYGIFRYDGSVFVKRKTLEEHICNISIERAIGGGLVVEDAEVGLIKFRHHRLQEFLVARRLLLPDPPQPDWPIMLGSPRWQETLLNYFAIGGNDASILKVILDLLTPAQRYFDRLEPLIERSSKIIVKEQKVYDDIKADVIDYVPHGGSSYTFSDHQQAKKDAAAQRLNIVQRRHERLKALSPDLEMAWSDNVLFASRACALLNQSTSEASGLCQPLYVVLKGLIKFGRPAIQVRMLSAWRELSGYDWCPVSVLDPVRTSKLGWVRSETIHALISTPLDKDRADNAFSEELEREMLNLRMPNQFSIFWEASKLRLVRRLLLMYAVLIHSTFALFVLAVVSATGILVVLSSTQTIQILSEFMQPFTWLGWLAVIGFSTLLTVPVSQSNLITRVATINAVIGGLALAILNLVTLSKSIGSSSYLDCYPEYFKIVGWAISPALITSAGLVPLTLVARTIYWSIAIRGETKSNNTRAVIDSEAGNSAYQIGVSALLFAAIATIILSGLILWFLLSSSSVITWLTTAIGNIAVAIIIIFNIICFIMYSWEKLEEIAVTEPLQIVEFGERIFGVAFYFCFLGAIVLVFQNSTSIFLGDLLIGLLNLITRAYDFCKWPLLWVLNISLSIFASVFSLFILSFIFRYVILALEQSLAEIRYSIIHSRFQQRLYTGTLAEWESSFRKASVFIQRELLESLDHRAMGALPQEVLNTLYSLEALVDLDKPAAEAFHKAIYKLQEAIRQQRWTTPVDSLGVVNSIEHP
jgi:TIR domain/NACHT domain